MSELSNILSVAKTFIPKVEGFSKYPVWDNKQWSWGHGTAAGYNINVKPTGFIDKTKAIVDAMAVITSDYNYLKPFVKVPLTPYQWVAILSFSYNLGRGNAVNLIANINKKDWVALESQFKKYVNANGKRNEGLVNRRNIEWGLFGNNSSSLIAILLPLAGIFILVFLFIKSVK